MDLSTINPAPRLELGNTVLDAGTLTLWVGSEQCPLTASEFRLLHQFFVRPNLLLPKEAIMEGLFSGQEKRPGAGILRVYVHRMRSRLRALGSSLTFSTRHGIGWILVVPASLQT